jgi:hypothetical protein
MSLVASQVDDKFLYHIMNSPMHIVGEDSSDTINSVQKRTRRFFTFVSEMKDMRHDDILPWGQTVGEFSMWYICHTHKQRLKK